MRFRRPERGAGAVAASTPIVVVTGPPASGKTTIAELIARKFSLPLFAKDAIKETLFDALGTGDREWSRRLGRATYELLYLLAAAQVRAGRSLVLESNFDAGIAEPRLRALDARIIQIYCTADPDSLCARYAARTRHPGHLGATVLDEVWAGIDSGRWAPLELDGEPVVLDTTRRAPTTAVLAAVAEHLAPNEVRAQ